MILYVSMRAQVVVVLELTLKGYYSLSPHTALVSCVALGNTLDLNSLNCQRRKESISVS